MISGGRFFDVSLKVYFLELCFLPAESYRKKEQHREDNGGKDTHPQIVVQTAGYESGKGGTTGATKVTGQRQQGKHGSTAAFDRGRSLAEGSGPQDTDRKTADCAAYKSKDRNRDQGNPQVGSDT